LHDFYSQVFLNYPEGDTHPECFDARDYVAFSHAKEFRLLIYKLARIYLAEFQVQLNTHPHSYILTGLHPGR